MYRLALFCLMTGTAASAFGQPIAAMARPEDMGLRFSVTSQLQMGDGRSVLVPAELASNATSSKEPLVAQVYLDAGESLVVMLPNGTLRSVAKNGVTATDRPFEAATKKQLTEELLEQFPGFRVKTTKRYLSVYNTSDSFCESKLTILETMYPMLLSYFRRNGFETHAPNTLMVIVMFNTKAEFQRYREMPDSILAYYNTVNNRVFLYHHSELDRNAPLIALKQSTSTIAHEGVHQILHNIGVQHRLSQWPAWISEGLPEYLSPTSVGRRSKWKGVGVPNELRMRELFEHLRTAPEQIGAGEVVQNVLTSDRLDSADYAVSWALTHYLATKHKDEFFAYLREVSELGPMRDSGNELERFVNHLGVSFADAERGMIQHVKELPYSDPVINQPHFLVVVETNQRKLSVVTSSTTVDDIKNDLMQKIPLPERPQIRYSVRTFPNRNLAEAAMQLLSN